MERNQSSHLAAVGSAADYGIVYNHLASVGNGKPRSTSIMVVLPEPVVPTIVITRIFNDTSLMAVLELSG